ncbi:unnamed protein product [Soboliphyme baturini]|uniref:DUF3700 domain-containing protein n=1 Tax=Soboliphyme baturini TaxID=241478 RepID=A0A183J348_9BILA|nr:unnamed protein product [Soboliphyme baturini]
MRIRRNFLCCVEKSSDDRGFRVRTQGSYGNMSLVDGDKELSDLLDYSAMLISSNPAAVAASTTQVSSASENGTSSGLISSLGRIRMYTVKFVFVLSDSVCMYFLAFAFEISVQPIVTVLLQGLHVLFFPVVTDV